MHWSQVMQAVKGTCAESGWQERSETGGGHLSWLSCKLLGMIISLRHTDRPAIAEPPAPAIRRKLAVVNPIVSSMVGGIRRSQQLDCYKNCRSDSLMGD
jgi:hypothetical protein